MGVCTFGFWCVPLLLLDCAPIVFGFLHLLCWSWFSCCFLVSAPVGFVAPILVGVCTCSVGSDHFLLGLCLCLCCWVRTPLYLVCTVYYSLCVCAFCVSHEVEFWFPFLSLVSFSSSSSLCSFKPVCGSSSSAAASGSSCCAAPAPCASSPFQLVLVPLSLALGQIVNQSLSQAAYEYDLS